MSVIEELASKVIPDAEEAKGVVSYLNVIAEDADIGSIEELLSALSAKLDLQEQELDPDKVNILTMHQAKGLEADVVIIAAAEDEYIPGPAQGEEQIDNERRLLYVSLSRARHKLFITHCSQRWGAQQYTKKAGNDPNRTLCTFLQHCPVASIDGEEYLAQLARGIVS